MRKYWSFFVLALSLCMLYLAPMPVSADQDGVVEKNGAYYYYVNGTVSLGNSTQYRRSSDTVRWQSAGADWYLIDVSDGHLLTGWQYVANNWYYLDPETCRMQAGGSLFYKGSYYFFAPWGGMYHDTWYDFEGKRYYLLNWGGAYKEGWREMNGIWYFFKEDGSLAREEWIDYKSNKYYLKADGQMCASEWLALDDKWYYFKSWGGMYSSEWLYYKSYYYYLQDSGVMAANGLFTIDGSKYGFCSWGGCYQNCSAVIAGVTCHFDANGRLQQCPAETYAASQKTNSLIVVKSSGTNAQVSMYKKDSDGIWSELLSVSGYVGRSGVGEASEDSAYTPKGDYHFLYGFGLADDPGCKLEYVKIDDTYDSVEDINSVYYNKIVSTRDVVKDWNAAEHLAYAPVAYQYALFFDYNKECVPGKGSGFFLHCSQGKPTSGCVSIPQDAMVQIMKEVTADTIMHIE